MIKTKKMIHSSQYCRIRWTKCFLINDLILIAKFECAGPVAGEADAPIAVVHLFLPSRALSRRPLLLLLHPLLLAAFDRFDGLAHPLGAHPLVAHANAHVAIFSLHLLVLTNGHLELTCPFVLNFESSFFALSWFDGATHPQRAHPLAADANARVTVLHLHLLIRAHASAFHCYFFDEGSEVGDAVLECAKPFLALADAPVAIDLVGATRGALLKGPVRSSLKAFSDVSCLNASLSSLQGIDLFFVEAEHHGTSPYSSGADAVIAVFLLRVSVFAFGLFSFARKTLHCASGADAGALAIARDFPFRGAVHHCAHPEGAVSKSRASATVAIQFLRVPQSARFLSLGGKTLACAAGSDAHLPRQLLFLFPINFFFSAAKHHRTSPDAICAARAGVAVLHLCVSNLTFRLFLLAPAHHQSARPGAAHAGAGIAINLLRFSF